MHNIFSDFRWKIRDIYFLDNIAEYSNPWRWYSISLYNVGWKCQTEDAHVATCCVTSYWLSNRYTKAAEAASFSMQAHRNARAQDVQFLCKLAAAQVPGITRCQLCHLPYSRDSRLDLSRLSSRRASFRIWSASLSLSLVSLMLLYVFYIPFFSLSPPLSLSLAIFRLSHLPCTRTRSFAPSPEIRVCAGNNCEVCVNKRMHALIRTRSQERG